MDTTSAADTPGAHVIATGLAASYGHGAFRVPVLEDIGFEVERGSVVVLMGASGSGKTTLLSLIGGLDTADTGSLRVHGMELVGLDRKALERYRRDQVAFVFQTFNLLPTLDVIENVETSLEPLGMRADERAARARNALDRVGLADKKHRLPHELSGGEQQRVAVARAWAKDPPLLLADEPTGNLDDAASAAILDLLVETPGHTVIIATHDPAVAARADRVLRLANRHIVEG